MDPAIIRLNSMLLPDNETNALYRERGSGCVELSGE